MIPCWWSGIEFKSSCVPRRRYPQFNLALSGRQAAQAAKAPTKAEAPDVGPAPLLKASPKQYREISTYLESEAHHHGRTASYNVQGR
jgi:hypothetical protein